MIDDMPPPPSDDEIARMLARFVSWPDKYGVDVPVKDGKPILGADLDKWINQHRHYSSENERARTVEVASFGFALNIKYAELECGFTWGKEMQHG